MGKINLPWAVKEKSQGKNFGPKGHSWGPKSPCFEFPSIFSDVYYIKNVDFCKKSNFYYTYVSGEGLVFSYGFIKQCGSNTITTVANPNLLKQKTITTLPGS